MSQFRKTPPQADIVYQRVHLHGPDIVNIMTIDNQKAGTVCLAGQKSRRVDEEINILAAVIAETHIDSPTNDAILTANGYANKESLKDALVKIESDHWYRNLETMLTKGAYIYKAIHQQETVGVIVLTHLTEEVPSGIYLPTTPLAGEFPFPDPSDLEAVETYAISDEQDREFMRQLRGHVNSHLRSHDTGELWELCGFGVKEQFRNQDIGRTLVKHALSHVPGGSKIILQGEPGAQTMYQYMGFRYAMSESGTGFSITIKPEWEKGPNDLVFPMMILQKEVGELSMNE
ncbi:hypothetical protein E0Z10_g9370 [Xylaria hypoxylon]|uniref:N-acetyltransferase domain-containing protein n=1 Tax=Xylaria hypoxylon TaxID=37992 RepID=A0A4Z0YSF5_9PEZI|nr:hypothetical protein E0Z10_g9370 [Xylaria hypoxylon]